MTYEEAKKHLKKIQAGIALIIDFGSVEEFIEHIKDFEDIKIILEALEKQIPKKIDIQCYCCPTCRFTASGENKYCPQCGQALDWSD